MTFSIGADPELFASDMNGLPKVAIGLFGGTKEEPRHMQGLGAGFSVQEDNVMVEFNVPPATDPMGFVNNVGTAMKWIERRLGEARMTSYKGNHAVFPVSELSSPQARTFGCSPDFNAYAGMYGDMAKAESVDPLSLANSDGTGEVRFAGGHIHLGHTGELSNIPHHILVMFMDLALGAYMTGTDKQMSVKWSGFKFGRRALYGQAGRYRVTSYGIEYRTLSNCWIFSRDVTYYLGCRAMGTMHFLANEPVEAQKLYASVPWSALQVAINTENKAVTSAIVKEACNLSRQFNAYLSGTY